MNDSMNQKLVAFVCLFSLIAFCGDLFAQGTYSNKAVKATQSLNKTKSVAKTLDTLETVKDVNSLNQATVPPLPEPAVPEKAVMEQLNTLENLKDVREKMSRFKNLDEMEIELTSAGDFKKLTIRVMAELDTELAGIESLFSDNEEALNAAIKAELQALNKQQLKAEENSKTALNKAQGKINKASKTPFIVALYYTKFELE